MPCRRLPRPRRCLQYRKRILEISQQVSALHGAGAFSALELVDCAYGGLMRGRPDLMATLHTHTVNGMGVAAHKFGLLPINQHAMGFYGEVKYHEFEGLEFDHDMTPKLLRDLEGGSVMILRNHGLLVCGESVAECVVTHHFLEMACAGQIAALAAGQGNYTTPSPEACAYAHSQIKRGGKRGSRDWAACLRLAERLDPGYKT